MARLSHTVGWHLGNVRSMGGVSWSVVNKVPPAAIAFLTGEAIGGTEVREILRISPHCHFFLRPYYAPSDKEEDFRGYLNGAKSLIAPGNWNMIPEGQRHLQIFNEQNMPHTAPIGHPDDQWEGFGPTEFDRFNRWFCIAYDELKEVNPTWKIGFTPLTPGNRDCYFRTDPEHVPYYMHGPEASFGDPCDPDVENPTQAQIDAAILSGPCYEALMRADEYLAHIYVINDAVRWEGNEPVGGQIYELWSGLRFAQYAKFFPKPMDVWITELGVGGESRNWEAWYRLLEEEHPYVQGTGVWRLEYEIRSTGDNPVVGTRAWTGGEVPVPVEVEPEPPPEPEPGVEQARCLVGACGRNDYVFQGRDFDLVRGAGIEALKMMSLTIPETFAWLREDFPDLRFIVRLYDDRMRRGYHPSPVEFVTRMSPTIDRLQPYATLFEVHNEPNHLDGIEGWGQEDDHARDFNVWFCETFDLLKGNFPWASFGFPGLAVPHRDLEWLDICREAIERVDFLGAHCYWQNPAPEDANHLSDFWGLRFTSYHEKYPNKDIHITEFGNSNGQSGFPVDHDVIAGEYHAYYVELFNYPYLKSASAFIMSAPQPEWVDFCWREESGHFRPVVEEIGGMYRPPLFEEPEPEPADLVESVRDLAWWQGLGIEYTREFAFPKYAHAHELGPPLTKELRLVVNGEEYAVQGFRDGIAFCRAGKWDEITHIEWG